MVDEKEIERRWAAREEAALKIDPATAVMVWWFANSADPYDDYKDDPSLEICLGREYFARAPDSDVWILVRHLPAEIQHELWLAEHYQTIDDLPPGLEQSMMHMVKKFPYVFRSFDQWFTFLRDTADVGSDGRINTLWRHRSLGLDKLAEVVRKARR